MALELLQLRADLLNKARVFFAQRDVLEIDTPILSPYAIVDSAIDNITVNLGGVEQAWYLQTSPEVFLKRLLAAIPQDIYQIGKVFRDAESGSRHNPEFTLVEWYRLGFSLNDMIEETLEFCSRMLKPYRQVADVLRVTYQDLFLRFAEVDPFTATSEQLIQSLNKHNVPLPEGPLDHQALLDLLLTTVVEPQFPSDSLLCVFNYPAEQAALARINPEDSRVASRFEVYFGTCELANGYHELQDADEQRRRFASENAKRLRQGKLKIRQDELFLGALEHGLPDCAGVALGFDRLLMLCANKSSLKEVLTFSMEQHL